MSHTADAKHPKQPAPADTPPLEGDAMVTALKKQLEFYFSTENLATDAFLVSQMNAQKWVPVDVIANFRKVRTLTEDKEVLVGVMRQCKNLMVDDANTMVRPNVKMERNTLFLREIPTSTAEADVRAIFAADEAKFGKVVSIRADINDIWFVTFENQDECTNWALELSSRQFQGKPIRCGVKSENLLRGFYYPGGAKQESGAPAPAAAAAPNTGAGRGAYRGQQSNGFYNAAFNGFPQGAAPAAGAATPAPVSAASAAASASGTNASAPAYVPNWTPGFNKPTDGAFYAGRGGASATAPVATPASPQQGGKSRVKGGKGKKGTAGGAPLGKDNWPALPSAAKKEAAVNNGMLVGYTAEFAHYDKTKMAAIFEAMVKKGPLTRPSTMPTPSECVAVRSSAMTSCQLLEPMPVFFPASPSPIIAAQTAPFQSNMPFLDLSSPEPSTGTPIPAAAPANAAKQPLSSLVGNKSAAAVAKTSAPTAAAAKKTKAASTATAARGGRGGSRGGRGAATTATRGGRPASATTPALVTATASTPPAATTAATTSTTPAIATTTTAATTAAAPATAATAAAKSAKRPTSAKKGREDAKAAAPAKVAPNPQSWSAKAAGLAAAGGVAPKPAAKVAAKQAAAPATNAATTSTPAAAATTTAAPVTQPSTSPVGAAGGKLSYAETARRAGEAAAAAAKSS